MNKNSILIPFDFSEASSNALSFAARLAKTDKLDLTLLHITNSNDHEEIIKRMNSSTEQITTNGHPKIEKKIRKGKLIDEISDESCEDCYRYMIIGSHGFKGIREKLLGTDILKLLKTVKVPVICIQKEYKLPPVGIKKILFPASEHKSFAINVKATLLLARTFDAEVLIYTIRKPGIELSNDLRENIRKAKSEFEAAGVQYSEITEEQKNFSVGYSKQILTYAKNNQVDIIGFMTNPTPENYYIADHDKEQILTNDLNVPVLCTNNVTKVYDY